MYCCPDARCGRAPLSTSLDGLRCPNGHFFPFLSNTAAPVFVLQGSASEYAAHDAAARYDNALRWLFATFGEDEAALRRSLVRRLQLSRGQKVLVTGAGTCCDLPFLAERLEEGEIHVQDLSQPMLLEGMARSATLMSRPGLALHFSVSDAAELPYADDAFDAAFHVGGINCFADVRKGIAEMDRVVRPQGRVVICDEGIAPWLADTAYGRMLVDSNPLWANKAPLELLPPTARDVQVGWELGNSFYVISFGVSNKPLTLNIDEPHVGTRGGTLRTRHFGKLEGVDPALRDRIHAEAERRGMSRVAYLEQVLRAALAE